MTSIQRPGGPTGPGGIDAASDVADTAPTTASQASGAAMPLADLAAAVDRGAVAAKDALAQLVEESVAGLPPEEADALRADLAELFATDPYLSGLAGGLGVPIDPGEGA